ncbi:hypothetical protein BKA81DRAFT_132138 [Phyllosticta paracitricarpa]
MLACLPVCLLACTCGCCNQRIPLRLFVLPSVFTPLSTYQISPTLFLSCLLAPDRLCETQSEAEHRPSCSRGGLVVRPSARSLECVGERQRRSVDPDSRFHLGCGQGARGRRAGVRHHPSFCFCVCCVCVCVSRRLAAPRVLLACLPACFSDRLLFAKR